MNKISFVCTTYRRFFCVERIILQFLEQTYKDSELIIFNTDVEHPFEMGFNHPRIFVYNNNINYLTEEPYTNRGDICRDAVSHATGDYFMLADDDDIYLPWHLQQAIDKIKENGKDAWKPEKSFFATRNKLELTMNTMEASVIVKMNRIKEIGFRNDITGFEGLSWYTKLRDEGQLDEHNQKYIPSYCFNWGDPPTVAGHKQSGDINNPDNFENHKTASMDYASRPLFLAPRFYLTEAYLPFYEYIKKHENEFDNELLNKYVNL